MPQPDNDLIEEFSMFQNAMEEYNTIMFLIPKDAIYEQGYIMRILLKEHAQLLSKLAQ